MCTFCFQAKVWIPYLTVYNTHFFYTESVSKNLIQIIDGHENQDRNHQDNLSQKPHDTFHLPLKMWHRSITIRYP